MTGTDFEALRGWVAITGSRLDVPGRARLALALCTGELDAEVPLAALVRGVADTAPLASLCAQIDADLEPVLGRLGNVARIDGRVAIGWPELVLALAVCDERGRASEALRGLLRGPARRLSDLIEGLLPGLTTDATVRTHETDADGRPLYVDPEGQTTHRANHTVLARDPHGEVLFVPPPEMGRERFVVGYTHAELWARHFMHAPHGEVKLAAWVNDGRNAVTVTRPNPPKRAVAVRDPAREQAMLDDLSALLSEVRALEEALAPLGALAAGPSVLLDAEAWAEEGRRALSILGEHRARLEPLLVSMGAPPVAVAERRTLSTPDGTSSALLRFVAARSGPPLGERLAQMRAARAVIEAHPPRRFEGLALRPSIAAAAGELFGAVVAEDVALRDAIVMRLFEAEAIAERGERAYLVLAGSNVDARAEARRTAEELAVVHLRNVPPRPPHPPLAPIAARLAPLLTGPPQKLTHQDRELAAQVALAAACVAERERLLASRSTPLFAPGRGGPVVFVDLRAPETAEDAYPAAFAHLVAALAEERIAYFDGHVVRALDPLGFLDLCAFHAGRARLLPPHPRLRGADLSELPANADVIVISDREPTAHGLRPVLVASGTQRLHHLWLGSGIREVVPVVIDPHARPN